MTAPRACWANHLVGQRIGGRYDVERVVGAGGGGAVLAAKHIGTDRRVALKVAPSHDEARARRLAAEARVAASFDHPGIVDVMDFGHDVDAGVVYLAQRLLRGCNLSEHLAANGPLSPREAVSLLAPAMGALVEVHRRGVVHRDVKLENLFLVRDPRGEPRVMLLDFGLAKPRGGNPDLETRPGNVVGSPLTMSPEQACGISNVGPQTDVWALGVAFFELVSGGTPFRRDDIQAILRAVVFDPIPRLDTLCPSVPKVFADIVARAMERDITKRYLSVAAMLNDLLECDLPESTPERVVVTRPACVSTFSEGPAAWPALNEDERPTRSMRSISTPKIRDAVPVTERKGIWRTLRGLFSARHGDTKAVVVNA